MSNGSPPLINNLIYQWRRTIDPSHGFFFFFFFFFFLTKLASTLIRAKFVLFLVTHNPSFLIFIIINCPTCNCSVAHFGFVFGVGVFVGI